MGAKANLLSAIILATLAATMGVQFSALVACGLQPTLLIFGSARSCARGSQRILHPWSALLRDTFWAVKAPYFRPTRSESVRPAS